MTQAAMASLTILQEEAYNYILKQRKVEYDKDRLQSELDFISTRSVTRSFNKLIELDLIKAVEEAGSIYLVHPNYEKEMENGLKPENSVSITNESTEVVSTLGDMLPTNVLNRINELKSQAPEQVEVAVEQESEETTPAKLSRNQLKFLYLVKEEDELNGQPLLNNNQKLSQSFNLSKLTIGELKKGLIQQGYLSLTQQGCNSYLHLTPKGCQYLSQLPEGSEVEEVCVKPTQTRKVLSTDTGSFLLKTTYNALAENEKTVYSEFAKYMLANPSLKYCSYRRLNAIANKPSAQLKVILYSLQQKQLIIVQGGEGESVVYLSHERAVIEHVFPEWKKEDSPSPSSLTKRVTIQPSELMKDNKQVKVQKEESFKSTPVVIKMPAATPKTSDLEIVFSQQPEAKPEQPCIYLVDTENTGFQVFEDVCTPLDKDSTIVLLLSKNTSYLTPERFHSIMSLGCKVETELVNVLGRGQSDLDHALIAELTIRLMQDPTANYVILSKDKGYLGAIKHLEHKLKLAPGQLMLCSKF